jgi:regulator of protease activity HflC (stomatin/prohibitin superfamily)
VLEVLPESLILTGDENIVDIHFVVFWRIRDAQKYLFNIQSPEVTVKDVAKSAMRDVVGQSNIQPILTEARQKTEQAVQKLMQDVLDRYGAGISVARASCRSCLSISCSDAKKRANDPLVACRIRSGATVTGMVEPSMGE